MKLLRNISIIVVIFGILVWFLAPLIPIGGSDSPNGIPAASLIIYGEEDYALFKDTPLYTMAQTTIILLSVCLLLILFKHLPIASLISVIAIAIMLFSKQQIQTALDAIVWHETNLHLGIAYPLLIGVFAALALIGLVYVFLAKQNNEHVVLNWGSAKMLRIISLIVIAVGFLSWLLAPFFVNEVLGTEHTMSASALLSSGNLEEFGLEQEWKQTPLFWMPLMSLMALVLGLIDVIGKKPGSALVTGSGLSLIFLIGGGLLTSVSVNAVNDKYAILSSLWDVRFGFGFYLLVVVFIVLLCLGVAMKKEIDA